MLKSRYVVTALRPGNLRPFRYWSITLREATELRIILVEYGYTQVRITDA